MPGSDAARAPQFAGILYPAEKLSCLMALETATTIMPAFDSPRPKVVVAPQAPWPSGLTLMGQAFAPLKRHGAAITRVVLVAQAQNTSFSGLATASSRAWQTPIGAIEAGDATLQLLTVGQRVKADDALFTREPGIETVAPMIKHLLPRARLVPLLIGEAPDAMVLDVLRALWGGPETLIVVASDLGHGFSETETRLMNGRVRMAIETLKPVQISRQDASCHAGLRAVLTLARMHDLRFTCIDLGLSTEVVGGRQRLVGHGAFIGEYAKGAVIDCDNRALLLDVARDCLKSAIRTHGRMPILTLNGELPSVLSATRASFVTLVLDGRQRGCAGTVQPHRCLLDDVAANAVKAAFSDAGMTPLVEDDLERLDIDIAILSHPRPLYYSSEADLLRQLRADADGLILADQGKNALFLPSVWDALPSADDFWRGLKRKAGLADDHFTDTMVVRRFTVERFGSFPSQRLGQARLQAQAAA